ncbi:MAG: sulfite exporter TauE/SafE family protein, partial [Actinomycetota bacterium]|nr:sulfite exporter TauE/SafE family protein [Actinomycetota bacterium]
TVVSFAALFAAGQVMREDVVLALELVPALLIGLAAGPAIVRRTDGRWLRPAVLAFAAAGGLAIIARGLA